MSIYTAQERQMLGEAKAQSKLKRIHLHSKEFQRWGGLGFGVFLVSGFLAFCLAEDDGYTPIYELCKPKGKVRNPVMLKPKHLFGKGGCNG